LPEPEEKSERSQVIRERLSGKRERLIESKVGQPEGPSLKAFGDVRVTMRKTKTKRDGKRGGEKSLKE